ncbi:MAG: hypothetical protein E7233_02945 [Lachnospiraceae bacterium]|nr:hypothetical protein [Lachnospiraceae bacterium]
MTSWKIVGNSTGEMTAELGGDKWKETVQSAKERLEQRSRQVGANPSEIERKDILNAALNLCISDIFQNGIRELDLIPVSEAVVDVPSITSEGVTVVFKFAVAPEFKLGDLSSLKYEVEPVTVSKEDIEAEITELKKSMASQGQIVPEDDDEFARLFGLEGVETIDDMRASINDALQRSRMSDAVVKAEDRLLDDLCSMVDLEAPDGLVDMEVDSLIAADKDKVASMNGDWEEFLKTTGKSEAELREEYRPEAARNIKIRLILERISEENHLNPSAQEIEAEYILIAGSVSAPLEDIKSAIPEEDIIYQKRLVMAMDFLKKTGI